MDDAGATSSSRWVVTRTSNNRIMSQTGLRRYPNQDGASSTQRAKITTHRWRIHRQLDFIALSATVEKTAWSRPTPQRHKRVDKRQISIQEEKDCPGRPRGCPDKSHLSDRAPRGAIETIDRFWKQENEPLGPKCITGHRPERCCHFRRHSEENERSSNQ